MSESNSPISSSLRALLALFDEDLADVRFGNIGRDTLNEAASRVLAAAQQVAAAEAALDLARTELAATQETLLVTGQRAHAHAKIYAETSPELQEQLAEISLAGGSTNAGATRETETKARRRARKDASDEMPALPGTVTMVRAAAPAGIEA